MINLAVEKFDSKMYPYKLVINGYLLSKDKATAKINLVKINNFLEEISKECE